MPDRIENTGSGQNPAPKTRAPLTSFPISSATDAGTDLSLTDIFGKGFAVARSTLWALGLSVVISFAATLAFTSAMRTAGAPESLLPAIAQLPQVVAAKTPIAKYAKEQIGGWLRNRWPVVSGIVLSAWVMLSFLCLGQLGSLAATIRGKRLTIGRYWRGAIPYLPAYFLGTVGSISVLVVGGFCVPGMASEMADKFLPLHQAQIVTYFTFRGALVVVFWLYVRTCLWSMALVSDGFPLWRCFQESFERTRGHWWKLAVLSHSFGWIYQFITHRMQIALVQTFSSPGLALIELFAIGTILPTFFRDSLLLIYYTNGPRVQSIVSLP